MSYRQLTAEQYAEMLRLLDKAQAIMRRYKRNRNKIALAEKLEMMREAEGLRKQAMEIGQ